MGSLEVAKDKESSRSALPKQPAFAVRRRFPELVGPASPTPLETKRLSDIDDQDTLRGHVRFALFYRGSSQPQKQEDDPVGVIRRALAEALVPYYPLAGRLREAEARKLVVDCAGQGVLFVEAHADVRLAELQAAGPLTPPFPCMDQLLFDVQGSDGILDSPLLLIQVTRLLCGGFVFALRLNHTACDAIGIVQFMGAVAELARGLPSPTVTPAWSRELLEARDPPSPSFPHREYDLLPPPPPPPDSDSMVLRTFSFSSGNIAALKKRIGEATTTTFEALAAALWIARTKALEIPEGELARLAVIANFRPIAADPDLDLPSTGYYGNACVPPTALTDAGDLRRSSSMALGEAAALVREAKGLVTAEYVRSTAAVLAGRGRPCLALANLLVVSDLRHAGFRGVDFGWGEPVYGGPADTVFGVCFFVAVKGKEEGEDAVAVPVVLPRIAMERLAAEVESLCQA